MAPSPTFAFPEQLLAYLASTLPELTEAEVARLPAPDELLTLLETAYVASLETDENRPITFRIACTPAGWTVPGQDRDVQGHRLATPRPYEVQELRRLAVATDPDNTALWVQRQEGQGMSVVGLLDLGSGRAFGPAGSQGGERLPGVLMLNVEGPGRLGVIYNDAPIVSLAGGMLKQALAPGEALFGTRPWIDETEERIRERLEGAGFTLTPDKTPALTRSIENLLLGLLGSIQQKGHGGVVLYGDGAAIADAIAARRLKPKYEFSPAVTTLSESFTAMLLARFELTGILGRRPNWRRLRTHVPETHSDLQRIYLLGLEIANAQAQLLNALRLVADLTGTDGAIALTTDLRLIGFGVEISHEGGAQPKVYDIDDHGDGPPRLLDTEAFGMRHRSAMRLVRHAEAIAAFVVSQDGSASAIFSRDGRVSMRRNLPVAPLV
jgi:hypothetical protein